MSVNQNIYRDDQNIIIDINKLYSDYILEIDNIRSYSNISNSVNNEFFKTLSVKTINSIANLVKVESTPQESRCHAFFRLIGFPVVDSNLGYYNPGFDNIILKDKLLTIDKKITISNNISNNLKELSRQREIYENKYKNIFSKKGTLYSSVLSLTNIKGRDFNVPLQEDNYFSPKITNQKFKVDLTTIVGNKIKKTNELTDQSNIFISDNELFPNRYHYILPFITDPKIDFTVYPLKNRVAVPFVFNKTQLKITEDTYVKRPLLEKIIRERIISQSNNNINDVGEKNKEYIDYIKNIDAIKDENIIKQIYSNDIYKLSEIDQFIKYLNIIRALCNELVNCQINIENVQKKYYWLPIINENGIEKGVSNKNIIISKGLPKDLITKYDKDIILYSLKQISNSFNSQLSGENIIPDNGNFAFDNFTRTFEGNDSEGIGDANLNTLNSLLIKRNNEFNDASNSLQKIEMIMGNFSGLGLSDIIVIIGALHIMPLNDLFGFLDNDAFNRMIILLNKQQEQLSNPGIEKAMNSFVQKVSDLYNLMDKIYNDILLKMHK